MTHRERILQAINHKEPDKIPVDCGSDRSTGITAVAYNALKKYLNINNGETKIYDVVQQLAIPEKWYLELFQIDSVDLARFFAENTQEWKDWILPDGSPAKLPKWIDIQKRDKEWVCIDQDSDIIAKIPDSSYFFEQTIWPLYGIKSVNYNKLPNYMNKVMWGYMSDPLWRNAKKRNFFKSLNEKAKNAYEKSDYVIMLGFGGALLGWGQALYGMEDFLINLVINKKETNIFLDHLVELHLENLDKVIEAVNTYIDIISFGDDLGTQNGPMISPEMYKEMIFPRQKKLFQRVKEKTNMYVYLHSCGDILEFIPYLIDAGVDIINPVQISTKGMRPEKLKKNFGKYITFWGGGIDTQHTLPRGTPDAVRSDIRKNCEIFMKDGGFIFTQVHNILAGVPPENIVTMYDEVNKIRY